uniref:Uncharacterized protein n=1 Tax=Anguilla anguilla TaxID=7936 RepID=A0A0E9QJL9_ANGAN
MFSVFSEISLTLPIYKKSIRAKVYVGHFPDFHSFYSCSSISLS